MVCSPCQQRSLNFQLVGVFQLFFEKDLSLGCCFPFKRPAELVCAELDPAGRAHTGPGRQNAAWPPDEAEEGGCLCCQETGANGASVLSMSHPSPKDAGGREEGASLPSWLWQVDGWPPPGDRQAGGVGGGALRGEQTRLPRAPRTKQCGQTALAASAPGQTPPFAPIDARQVAERPSSPWE